MSEITVTVLGSTSGSSLVTGGETVSVLLPTGPAGADAKQVEFQSTATFLQWRREGETAWNSLVPLSSILGPPNVLSIGTVTAGPTAAATITGTSPSQMLSLVLPARQPEFQSNGDFLQWRLVGDTAWNNLVAQSSLVGPRGPSGGGVRIGTVLALS
jgi:type II secretory pathway component PulK